MAGKRPISTNKLEILGEKIKLLQIFTEKIERFA